MRCRSTHPLGEVEPTPSTQRVDPTAGNVTVAGLASRGGHRRSSRRPAARSAAPGQRPDRSTLYADARHPSWRDWRGAWSLPWRWVADGAGQATWCGAVREAGHAGSRRVDLSASAAPTRRPAQRSSTGRGRAASSSGSATTVRYLSGAGVRLAAADGLWGPFVDAVQPAVSARRPRWPSTRRVPAAVWPRYDRRSSLCSRTSRPAGGACGAPVTLSDSQAQRAVIGRPSDVDSRTVSSRSGRVRRCEPVVQASRRPAGGTLVAPPDRSRPPSADR